MPVENYVVIDIQELSKVIAYASNQFKKKFSYKEYTGNTIYLIVLFFMI